MRGPRLLGLVAAAYCGWSFAAVAAAADPLPFRSTAAPLVRTLGSSRSHAELEFVQGSGYGSMSPAPIEEFRETPETRPWLRSRIDFMYMALEQDHNVPIVVNGATQAEIASTGWLDLDWQGLPRTTITLEPADNLEVQFVSFICKDWDAHWLTLGNNNLALPGDLGVAAGQDFFGADRMNVNYGSEVRNFEVNAFWKVSENGWSLMAGYRHFVLKESLGVHGFDNQTSTTGSDYRIGTDNYLHAGQIGLRWAKWFTFLRFDLTGKMGLAGNSAEQRQILGDFNNTVTLRNTATRGEELSFLAEFGVNATLPVGDHLRLMTGYNMLWITDVARAPDQLDYTFTANSGRQLKTSGDAFLNGLHAGFEWVW